MRGRALVAASITLNLILGAAWLVHWRGRDHGAQPSSTNPRKVRFQVGGPNTNPPGTHVVVRRQYFHWSEIESEDYRRYIVNLREIGCPEETVRDIIVADVNVHFDRRRLREIVPDDPPWWKGNTSRAVAESISEKRNALEQERRALLTELLGPKWEPARTQPGEVVYFTGPVLGALPEETKLAVQDILTRSTERVRQLRREADREETENDRAWLRQQTRADLAKVLTPEQMEEYLLRWSQTSSDLRRKLGAFEVTAEQFRELFRAADRIDASKVFAPEDRRVTNPTEVEKAEAASLAAFQRVLGAEKFEQYTLNQDENYTQVRSLATKAELPLELVQPMYAIQLALNEERERIRADKTLTVAEQEEVLAELLLSQSESLRQLLGEENYRKYTNSQPRPPPSR